MKMISKTHEVKIGKPGDQKTIKRGEPFDGPQSFIDRGIAEAVRGNAKPKDETPGININQATAEELAEGVTGIGKETAQDVVAAREADGPFKSIQDAGKRVGGVTVAMLKKSNATV